MHSTEGKTMPKKRQQSSSERERLRQSTDSASSRKTSGSKSSHSTTTKSPSPLLSRKAPSPFLNRQRGGLTPSQHSPAGRDQGSRQSSPSSRSSSTGLPSRSPIDQFAVLSDLCENSEVEELPSGDRLQTMRDAMSRRREEHVVWRENFAQRSDRVERALERMKARGRTESNRKDATTEMDRVVLGRSSRWQSYDENCAVDEQFRRIHTQ